MKIETIRNKVVFSSIGASFDMPTDGLSHVIGGNTVAVIMCDFDINRLLGDLGYQEIETNIWGFDLNTADFKWKVAPISALTGGENIHGVPTPYVFLRADADKLIARNWVGFEVEISTVDGSIRKIPNPAIRYIIPSLHRVEIGEVGHDFRMPIAELMEEGDTLFINFDYHASQELAQTPEEYERNIHGYSLIDGRLLWKVQPLQAMFPNYRLRKPGEAAFQGLIRDGSKVKSFGGTQYQVTIDPATGELSDMEWTK